MSFVFITLTSKIVFRLFIVFIKDERTCKIICYLFKFVRSIK